MSPNIRDTLENWPEAVEWNYLYTTDCLSTAIITIVQL